MYEIYSKSTIRTQCVNFFSKVTMKILEECKKFVQSQQ